MESTASGGPLNTAQIGSVSYWRVCFSYLDCLRLIQLMELNLICSFVDFLLGFNVTP